MNIASVSASIGLDTRDFQQGLQGALQRLAGFGETLRGAGGDANTLARGLDGLRGSGEKLLTVERQMDASAKAFMENWNRTGTTLDQTRQKTDKAAVSLRQFGAAASQAGRAMAVGISAPLVAVGAFALDSSQKIQRAMNVIRTETGATGAKLAGLGTSFRQVAGQVPQDLETTGKAVALLAQRTNLTGTALTGLSTQFLTLARVTGGEVNPLITSATKVFAQWGVAVKDQGEALNQFLRAHEATGIGVQELTDKILKFGPALKTAGLSLAESEALLGAFNRQGVVGDKALTALNTTFAKWAKAGVTDAHGALTNLIAAIQKAPSAFAALKIATEAGMGGRGGADFVNAVRSGGVEFDKFLKIITGGKDTVKKAGDDTLTVGQSFDILKNKVTLAAKPLGDFIAQQLKGLADQIDKDLPKLKALGDAFEKQPDENKQQESRFTGALIALPLVTLAVGKAAQGMAGFGTAAAAAFAKAEAAGEGFFAIFASRAAALSALLVTLQVGAIAALALFITAYLTNFHGLRDDLKAGWESIWENASTGMSEFFSGFRRLGQESVPEVIENFRTGIAKLVDYWHAGVRALQGGGATEVPVTPQGLQASGFAQHLGTLAAPPVLPPVPGAGGLGGGDANAVPKLKELTEAQRQHLAALAAEARAKEILSLVNQGYTKHQAEIISQYGVANKAITLQTEAYDTQVGKIEKLRAANAAAEKEVRKLQAATSALQLQIVGAPASRVASRLTGFEGADKSEQAKVAGAQRAYDATAARLKAMQDAARQAAAQMKSLDDQIGAATTREQVALTALTGVTKAEVTAEELYAKALKTGNPLLIDHAQNLLAVAAAHAQAAANAKINAGLQAEYEDALMKVAAAGKATADRELELHGASKQLTAAQDALNAAWRQGDEFLIDLAGSFVDAERAQDAFAKSQAAARKLGGEIQAAYTREVERGTQQAEAAQGITHETAVAQQLLQQALKSGSGEMVLAAAATLKLAQAHDAAALAAKGQAKEERAQQQFLKRIATDTASTFANLFTDLYEHGFKGFFAKVIHGFSDMFRQIAADAVRSQVKSLVERLLGIGVSALAGGGGGGGAADLAAAGVNDGGALMQALPTFASGGNFFAGQPFIAGERGPELVLPRTSGTVIPHGQTAALQQQRPIVVNMTVHAADAQSFRRNSGALASDLHQKLAIANRRNG